MRWARKRASLAAEVVARKVGTKMEKVLAWEQGEAHPTFRQAQKFAHHVHIPFGYLFLDEPPVETLPIPDLRTVGDQAVQQPSTEFRDTINEVMRKWEWFNEYSREQQVEQLPFVGRYRIGEAAPGDVAKDIQQTVGINDDLRHSVASWEEFLRLIIHRAEESGVWILRNGVVGNNTHRPLSVEEFRGFVISDPFTPLIFINGRDSKAAQIFTVAHELAHIWIGESGITNLSLAGDRRGLGRVERFCNDVAAELLVPEADFHTDWDTTQTLAENAIRLARRFRVSSIVAARRAVDLRFVSQDDYWEFYNQQREEWARVREERQSGGGDYYLTTKARNGERFSRAVLANVFSGKLLFREAASLLGIGIGNMEKFAKEMGIR
jgi:Zn-dependent peptidase ImmA (M78 family)/DNA-binding XRE family transcriptional regulator